jgi:hypothetical protein
LDALVPLSVCVEPGPPVELLGKFDTPKIASTTAKAVMMPAVCFMRVPPLVSPRTSYLERAWRDFKNQWMVC